MFHVCTHSYFHFRSYLIQRPKDKSDPDPNVSAVLFHIWPRMLLVALAKLIILTCLAGLLGPYTFLAIVLIFLVDFVALSIFCKKRRASQFDPENIPLLEIDSVRKNNLQTTEEEEEEEEEFFLFTAALCSVWVPCVVGDRTRKIFLVSGLTSLVSSVLLLALAVGLALSGFQEHVHKRPFLLFCLEKNSPLLSESDVSSCMFSESNCISNENFHEERSWDAVTKLYSEVQNYQKAIYEIDSLSTTNKRWAIFRNKMYNASSYLAEVKEELDKYITSTGPQQVQQKVRVCEESEDVFRVCLLSGLLGVIALAAYSIFMLHKISDYEVGTYMVLDLVSMNINISDDLSYTCFHRRCSGDLKR